MLIHDDRKTSSPDGLEVVQLTADDEAAIEAFRSRIYSRRDTWIQELLCNARDAVRERRKADAEHEGLIRITFDRDEMVCIVEDDGLGMSDETLRTVFATLGRSTRRGSNDYTGAWGIGSKSPLKIADSFQLTTRSIQDQRAYTIRVGRYEVDGQARWGFVFLDSQPCTGPWGTRIEVAFPADLLDELEKKAAAVAWSWDIAVEQVTVVDAKPSVSLLSQNDVLSHLEYFVQTPDFILGKTKSNATGLLSTGALLLDGVPYARPFEYGFVCVFHRPGMVDLTSGREAVDDSPRTKESLDAAKTAYQAQLKVDCQRIAAVVMASPKLQERQPALKELRRLESLVISGYHHNALRELELPGVLFQEVPSFHIPVHTGTRIETRATWRTLWHLLEGPLLVGSRWNDVEVTQALERIGWKDIQHPSHMVLAQQGDPLREFLRPFQEQEIFPKPPSAFRVKRHRHGHPLRLIEDPAELDRCVPVFCVPTVREAQRLPDQLLTVLVRASRRSLKTLKAKGFTVLDEASVRRVLGAIQLNTSAGRMRLATVARRRNLACVHGCEPDLLPRLRHKRQWPKPATSLVVDATIEEQHALRFLAAAQTTIEWGSLTDIRAGRRNLKDQWSRRLPGLPELYNHIPTFDDEAQRAFRHLVRNLSATRDE